MNTASNLPSASVIIPTKDRPQDLERTIATILAQTVLPQEIIILDQSSQDEPRRRVEAQLQQAPDSVRAAIHLTYIRDQSVTGLAQARNRTMELASGQVWVFFDDDVVLEPDFLEEMLKTYVEAPELTGVSGVITNYPPPAGWLQLWTRIFLRGPFRDDRQPIYWNAERLRHSKPVPVSRFGGGLMSFRGASIRAMRFDENLRGVSEGEDVDFCCRLPAGSRLVICPRARLAHMHSTAGRSRDHALRRMVVGPAYLYWKNWDHGVVNRLCFLWFKVGCGLLASMASLRRGSLAPWRALRAGIADAKQVFRRNTEL